MLKQRVAWEKAYLVYMTYTPVIHMRLIFSILLSSWVGTDLELKDEDLVAYGECMLVRLESCSIRIVTSYLVHCLILCIMQQQTVRTNIPGPSI